MIKYLVITIIVLLGLTGVSGYLLKREIGISATLKQSMVERDAAIKTLSDEIASTEAKRAAFEQRLAERDQANRDAEARATRFQNALRVARQRSKDFDHCLAMPVDAELVNRLFDPWPGSNQDSKQISP